jgi:Lipopolysaccharide-assembly
VKRLRWLLALGISLWFLAGCGYHFAGSNPILPGRIRTIEVPIFQNATARAFLESILTNHVRSRFSRFTGVKLVNEGRQAEGRLVGKIVAYEVKATAFDALDNIIEYTATMQVEVSLKQTVDGKILWKNLVSWDGTFPAGIDKNLQEVNQQKAIVEICEKLAGEILYRMLEDF